MKTILRISIVLSLWFGGISTFAVELDEKPVNATEKDFNAVYDAYKGNPKKSAGAVKTEGDPDPACCGKDMSGAALDAKTNPEAGTGQGTVVAPAAGSDARRDR